MLFLAIETFRNGDAAPLYARPAERGRMLPDGLRCIDSWLDTGRTRCF